MRCKCRTESEFLECLTALTETIQAFQAYNEACPEEVYRALAVLATDPKIQRHAAEAAGWVADAQAARH